MRLVSRSLDTSGCVVHHQNPRYVPIQRGFGAYGEPRCDRTLNSSEEWRTAITEHGALVGVLVARRSPRLAPTIRGTPCSAKTSRSSCAGPSPKSNWSIRTAGSGSTSRARTASITKWGIEGGPPNGLIRNGITKDSLKIGEELIVRGYGTRDGSNLVAGVSYQRADGKEFWLANDGAEATAKARGNSEMTRRSPVSCE